MKKNLLMFCSTICVLSSPLWASASNLTSPEDAYFSDNAPSDSQPNSFDHYFMVNDEEKRVPAQVDPMHTVQQIFSNETIQEIQGQAYNLLKFVYHNENFGTPAEPYRRLQHFGTWIRNSQDGKCYNTRGRILIRDSASETETGSNPCTVSKGEWHDPYTGQTFYRASEIQIDHFVPLKNAYQSGAHQWNKAKRCLYGNFMSNGYHLISVSGRENMRKGDRGPEGYMPPNDAYACQYVTQWLKIKMIWSLKLNPSEEQTINSLVEEHRCDVKKFRMTAAELKTQRQAIQDNQGLCSSTSQFEMM